MDDDTIKPDNLCMVVRNTTGHPCIEADIGRPVKVLNRFLALAVAVPAPGVITTRLVPLWEVAATTCPHCGGQRDAYPEADLQKLRGPRQDDDVPAEKPEVIGVDLGRPATADETARLLEALR